jgi:hypothetical protein
MNILAVDDELVSRKKLERLIQRRKHDFRSTLCVEPQVSALMSSFYNRLCFIAIIS